MKKLLFIFIILFVVSQNSISQAISNSGFESWSNQTHFEDPDQFSSSNMFCIAAFTDPNVIKINDAITGNYALKLVSVNTNEDPINGAIFIGYPGDEMILGGTPFAERPDSVTGYVKYDVKPGDTAYIAVLFKKLWQPIGMCLVPFTGTQTEYQEFTASIQWMVPIITPDTLAVGILSSSLFGIPMPGSMLIVDNLQFIGATSPFPNGDFEEWNEFSSEEPDNWLSSNIFSLSVGETPITKTDDSYEGNYAIRIENSLTVWNDSVAFITNGNYSEDGPVGGMPIDHFPDKISGYYKYFPNGPDTALAGVFLFYNNSGTTITLEENILKLPSANNYTYFEVQVEYYSLPLPDTVNIAFSAGNSYEDSTYYGLGSVLFIDGLEITYKPSIGINNNFIQTTYNVFPNPADKKIFFEFYDIQNEEILLYIINSQGQQVLNKKINPILNQHIEIDISEFPHGIYFYKLKLNNKDYTGRFIVN
ncbi:MAG: T9SS type A sorting domain-containing protein [Bacteroidales bacterium]|nr:T9SS type A sorting domain-containing protein [Bacteroidales bacterium]